jgi:undecaprenyl-diphosphatase
MTLIEAILLAIVEGLTEFLPVSSTGHLIVTTAVLGMESTDFVKLFTIAVQPGAILAVLVLYWKRFFQSLAFYYKLVIAFVPAAAIGLLFNDQIDAMLESPTTVAISLIVGGFFLLKVDQWFSANESKEPKEPSYLQSWVIGCFQILSMIPGTSRSGATIVGGLVSGLTRSKAAEFSFFLAVPTLLAASAYKLLKYLANEDVVITSQEGGLLLIGNIVAFLVGLIAIKRFIQFLTRKGFAMFGWYRIVLGLLILIMIWSGKSLSLV